MPAPATALELVWASIAVALTAAGLIQLVRSVPWVSRRVVEGVKPWACDLCMSWWCSSATAVGATLGSVDPRWLLTLLPAFFACLWMTRRLHPPPPPGSGAPMPPLEES